MLHFHLHFLPDMPKLELLNFARLWCNILTVWWEVLCGFCWKFTSLSSSERILKIRIELTKVSPWVWCTTFLGHSVHPIAVYRTSSCTKNYQNQSTLI